MSEQVGKISQWIATEVREAGMRGAVVGLSGGIDSSVTAALCKKALGDNVLGVVMPCQSQPQDKEHALLVATTLKIMAVTVRLENAYTMLERALPDATKIAKANLKPRLRMSVLYSFANTLSYLVVGTGNKTELMLGYFTKYGDGGADILPLGDVCKTEVWELASELGIPDEIIERVPSAGLWDGQTDEGELGITYEQLDCALEAIESGNDGSVSARAMERVREMVRISAHKRTGPPIFKAAKYAGTR